MSKQKTYRKYKPPFSMERMGMGGNYPYSKLLDNGKTKIWKKEQNNIEYKYIESLFDELISKKWCVGDECYEILYETDSETIRSEQFQKNKKLHHSSHPAFIQYFPTGEKKFEQWYEHGSLHRLDGPAITMYEENGNIFKKIYFKENKLHRLNGPAVIQYKNGKLFNKWYFIYGEEIKPDFLHKVIFDKNSKEQNEEDAKIWYNPKNLGGKQARQSVRNVMTSIGRKKGIESSNSIESSSVKSDPGPRHKSRAKKSKSSVKKIVNKISKVKSEPILKRRKKTSLKTKRYYKDDEKENSEFK